MESQRPTRRRRLRSTGQRSHFLTADMTRQDTTRHDTTRNKTHDGRAGKADYGVEEGAYAVYNEREQNSRPGGGTRARPWAKDAGQGDVGYPITLRSLDSDGPFSFLSAHKT